MVINSLEHNGKTYHHWEAERLLEIGIPAETVNAAITQQELLDVHAQRQAAYREESDSLFLEWQYDKTPESEQLWRNKVTEIKARYPFPTSE